MTVICPDCGAEMTLRETKRFTYGDGRPRKFFGCVKFPRCKATHGAHPDGAPLGIPADQETKKARMEAHQMFDLLWKSGRMSRGSAYKYMQDAMGMSQDDAHIGRFNNDQCVLLISKLATGKHADLFSPSS